MSDDPSRRSERLPEALNQRLAFADLDEFVARYGSCIGEHGLFLRTRDPRPLGTRLPFELRLRTGEVALAGAGTVRWVQGLGTGGAGVPGMGLQFDDLTAQSRQLVERIARMRREDGAPPPMTGVSPGDWQPLSAAPSPPPVMREPPQTPSPPVLGRVGDEGAASAPFAPVIAPVLGRVGDEGAASAPSAPVVAPAAPVPPVAPPPAAPSSSWLRRGAGRAVSVGLDIGWGAVRIAAWDGDEVRLVSLGPGGGFPALAAEEGSAVVFGESARLRLLEGATGARGVVGLLGLWPSSPGAAVFARRQGLGVEEGPDGRAGLRLGGTVRSGQALVRGLVRAAMAQTERTLGRRVDSAVLSVPAGLNAASRRALREAVEAAVVVERMVPAPLAAVLAAPGRSPRRVLAIDLGEGRMEAAVLEQTDERVLLASCAAEERLAGADLDLALMAVLKAQFEKDSGLVVPKTREVFERLREAAAQAKEALGVSLEHEVVLPGLVQAGLSRAELRQRLPRARLQAVAEPVVERAVALARRVLAARGYGAADMHEVLLFGGLSRLPLFGLRLAAKLGQGPLRPEPVEGLAALGAARLSAGTPGPIVAAACGAAVGVAQRGGGVKRVLECHLPLPLERSYTQATEQDGQERIELSLVQGEHPEAWANDYLGTWVVGPLPPAPRGEAPVRVSLRLDEDGLLSVAAEEARTGRPLQVQLDDARSPDAAREALERS